VCSLWHPNSHAEAWSYLHSPCEAHEQPRLALQLITPSPPPALPQLQTKILNYSKGVEKSAFYANL